MTATQDASKIAQHLTQQWSVFAGLKNPQIRFLGESHLAEATKSVYGISVPNSDTKYFVALSPAEFPELASKDAACATAIVNALPANLALVIPEVLFTGMVDDRTLVVTQWCGEFSSNFGLRIFQKLLLSKRLVGWVTEVATQTVVAFQSQDLNSRVVAPLEWLASNDELSNLVRGQASAALASLEDRGWEPQAVLMHGDLWLGNVMFPLSFWGSLTQFKLTDWGGAQLKGYPVYDLVRVLDSLPILPLNHRKVIDSYLQTLGLTTTKGYWHLLCALGSYGLDPDQLSPQRLTDLINSCVAVFDFDPTPG